MESVRCDLCHCEATEASLHLDERMFQKGSFTIVRCKRCGLLYTNPRPTQEEISSFYPKGYYAYTPSERRKPKRLEQKVFDLVLEQYYGYTHLNKGGKKGRLAGRLRKIAAFPFYLRLSLLGKNIKIIPYRGEGRLLEIGCATGEALELFGQKGWTPYGVEMDREAARYASEARGLKVTGGTLGQARFSDSFFDVVYFSHAFEHLPNPMETLREVHRILKPAGRVIVKLPNAASLERAFFRRYWLHWDVPRHYYHFTQDLLKRALKETGFAVETVRYDLGTLGLRESLKIYLRERYGRELKDNRLLEIGLGGFACLFAYLRRGGVMVLYARKEG